MLYHKLEINGLTVIQMVSGTIQTVHCRMNALVIVGHLITSYKAVWIMMLMDLPTASMLVPAMQVVQFMTDMDVQIMTKMAGQTTMEHGFTAIVINKIGSKYKTATVMV